MPAICMQLVIVASSASVNGQSVTWFSDPLHAGTRLLDSAMVEPLCPIDRLTAPTKERRRMLNPMYFHAYQH